MKRFWILLILPILACGGLAESASPTAAPLASSPPTVVPPTQTDIPTVPPTQTPLPVASQFPNTANYEWRLIANGLFRPVDVQPAFDGSGRLYIIEKYGVIRIYEDGQLQSESFLNISDRVNDSGNEMGLLGLAFHPDYEQNGFFYVNYTGAGGDTFISRFQTNNNAVNAASETILLTVAQPYPNHNGGAVVFGPDGYLYLALGDGGLAGDPHKNGQNTSALLGKILRIDVNNGDPYTIPADNPFGNEVWAYGLRNPWRISFDRVSGDLWIGDVGQGDWEEIDYLPAGSPGGANFGWSIMEGNHDYDGNAQPDLILPVAEYSHSEGGCSVTGGYVYRGAMPEWDGIYLYADYCNGLVWGLIPSNGGWQSQVLFETNLMITSFGQDGAGEIYFTADSGGLYMLVKK